MLGLFSNSMSLISIKNYLRMIIIILMHIRFPEQNKKFNKKIENKDMPKDYTAMASPSTPNSSMIWTP